MAVCVRLLAVDEARRRVLAQAQSLGDEVVPLSEAAGRFLAEDIRAVRHQPPFAGSAMDGWAVRAADTPGILTVVGESAAGRGYAGELGVGQAVRIFTGAAVPAGADSVVIQEEAERQDAAVRVGIAAPGGNVRPKGQDFRSGDLLLKKGQRLDPWRLSLAAAAGQAKLTVARRPRVAVLSTGEEVIEPGGDPGPFQIFNSGTPALAALLEVWGAIPLRLKVVGDDIAAISSAVKTIDCDMIVTLGGASVGDYDLVKPAIAQLGLTMIVESIAVRPGKPTWFGLLDDGRRVLGLPGNPASALVCAELFLKPFLRRLMGADPSPQLVPAHSDRALVENGGREHWMRACLTYGSDGRLLARALRDQDSSLVTMFAAADALLRRPAGAAAVAAGGAVEVLVLDRLA